MVSFKAYQGILPDYTKVPLLHLFVFHFIICPKAKERYLGCFIQLTATQKFASNVNLDDILLGQHLI